MTDKTATAVLAQESSPCVTKTHQCFFWEGREGKFLVFPSKKTKNENKKQKKWPARSSVLCQLF